MLIKLNAFLCCNAVFFSFFFFLSRIVTVKAKSPGQRYPSDNLGLLTLCTEYSPQHSASVYSQQPAEGGIVMDNLQNLPQTSTVPAVYYPKAMKNTMNFNLSTTMVCGLNSMRCSWLDRYKHILVKIGKPCRECDLYCCTSNCYTLCGVACYRFIKNTRHWFW